MKGRFYLLTRDLHLYLGLLISPFVLVFAISVFFLVHSWLPGRTRDPAATRVVADLRLPDKLEALSGRALIDAVRPALDQAGVQGEVGWVQHFAEKQRLVLPVSVPG